MKTRPIWVSVWTRYFQRIEGLKLLKIFMLLPLLLLVSCVGEPDTYDSANNPIRFNELGGKYILINYWAEWCRPCLEEIPELNLLAEQEQARIVVMGVNFDGISVAELRAQQEKLGIQFPVLINDPAQLLQYETPEVLPTSYLFDPEQKLVATLVGPQTRDSILARLK